MESSRSFGLTDQRSIAPVEEIFVAPWREPANDKADAVFGFAPGALVAVADPELIAGVDQSLRSAVDTHTVAAADEALEGPASRVPPQNACDKLVRTRAAGGRGRGYHGGRRLGRWRGW